MEQNKLGHCATTLGGVLLPAGLRECIAARDFYQSTGDTVRGGDPVDEVYVFHLLDLYGN